MTVDVVHGSAPQARYTVRYFQVDIAEFADGVYPYCDALSFGHVDSTEVYMGCLQDEKD